MLFLLKQSGPTHGFLPFPIPGGFLYPLQAQLQDIKCGPCGISFFIVKETAILLEGHSMFTLFFLSLRENGNKP